MDLHRKRTEQSQSKNSLGGSAIEICRKSVTKSGTECPRHFQRRSAVANVYPWPQRPAGLVETGFKELGKRWIPILNVFDEHGVDLCYEIHPGEDLHDGVTYERFLKEVNNHPRACLLYDPSHFVLQQLDYLSYIDFYHERIQMFHVKDAEFNPTGKQGVYGGYQPWIDRAGRFRSLGDGQVDFKSIFSKLALMIIKAGPCWNGNVASNIRKTEQKKDPFY